MYGRNRNVYELILLGIASYCPQRPHSLYKFNCVVIDEYKNLRKPPIQS